MASGARMFLRQFLRSPRSVGAAWPSSPGLAETMLRPIDFVRARTIVEFGPGTGAFTGAIARRLGPEHRYLGIELNPAFVEALAETFPRLDFEEASVEELELIARRRGLGPIDAIVCGLPWASLPIPVQDRAFAAIEHCLAPDGVFVTFAYLQGLALPGARALRRQLADQFAHVSRTPVVWRNLPPAFAYVCRGVSRARRQAL